MKMIQLLFIALISSLGVRAVCASIESTKSYAQVMSGGGISAQGFLKWRVNTRSGLPASVVLPGIEVYIIDEKIAVNWDGTQWITARGYDTTVPLYIRSITSSQISHWDSAITFVPAQSFASLTGKPTTLSGYGITDAYPLSGNPSNFVITEVDPTFNTKFSAKSTSDLTEGSNLYYTASRFNTAFSGKSTTDLAEGSNLYFTNARSRSAISLTTTGNGAATYNSSTGVLNVPVDAGGTVTSVGVSSSDFSISGSPVTSSGNITANLNTSGVSAGTYKSVTVSTKGIVTGGSNITYNNTPGRSIVTVAAAANGFQISSTKDAIAHYSVTITTTVSLSGNSSGYILFEICPTNSSTASDWIEIDRVPSGQSGTLVVGLTLNQSGGGHVGGMVPTGWYARIRSVNVSGTPTYTYNSGQEASY